MTTHFYTNETPGAPVLDGQIGSLIPVLDFCLVTKMGWSKVRSGANAATYKAATGNAMYLGVDDSVYSHSAQLRIYETLPDNPGVGDTGFGAVLGDYFLVKSNVDNDHVRTWQFVSDEKLFHFCASAAGYQESNYGPSLTTFGEIRSSAPVDTFNTVLMASGLAGVTDYQALKMQGFVDTPAASVLVRAYNQLPGAVPCGKRTHDFWNSAVCGGAGNSVYPSTIEGGLLLSRIFVCEYSTGNRGLLKGLWAPTHDRPMAHGDTFAGSGDLAGRTFIAVMAGSGNAPGQFFLETSDTWAA